MNHRQWKKQFKKTHGRNPYVHEDKKKMPKTMADALKEVAQELIDGVGTLANNLAESFRELAKNIQEITEEDSTSNMIER